MSPLLDLNLIRLFDFYLAVMLLLGIMRRWSVYRDTLLIILGFVLHRRWGRLLARLNTHRDVVLNWNTFRPVIVALVLMAVQMIASRLLFPQATLTVRDLLNPWWQIALVLAAMLQC